MNPRFDVIYMLDKLSVLLELLQRAVVGPRKMEFVFCTYSPVFLSFLLVPGAPVSRVSSRL